MGHETTPYGLLPQNLRQVTSWTKPYLSLYCAGCAEWSEAGFLTQQICFKIEKETTVTIYTISDLYL